MDYVEKEVGGCHYYEFGEGASLYVLLSGWGTPHALADMYHIAMNLAHHSRVIIIDRLGYNGKEIQRTDRTFETVCTEISTVISKEIFLEKAIIIGHSLGGAYALYLALDQPDIVKEVFTLDMLPYTGRFSSILYSLNYIPGYVFRFIRVSKIINHIKDDTISDLLRLNSVPEIIKADALMRTRKNLYNKNVIGELRYIKSFIDRIKNKQEFCEIPVTFILSDKTEKMSAKSIPVMKSCFKNVSIINVGDSSHYVHHDRESKVLEIIINSTVKYGH